MSVARPASALPQLYSTILAFAVPLLLFFAVPLSVMANNISQLAHIDGKLAVYSLLFLGLTGAVPLIAAVYAIRGRGPESLLQWALVLGFSFVFLAGFLFPLTGASGQMETSEIPLNWKNVAFALLISGCIAVAQGRLREIAVAAMVAYASLQSVASAYVLMTKEENGAFQYLTAASSTENIFVVSFDGLSGPIVAELLNEDAELRRRFKDFIVVTDAVSTAPSTHASIAAETMGGYDLKALYETEARLFDQIDKDQSITSYLASRGYDVSVYGEYGLTFNDPSRVTAQMLTVPKSILARFDHIGGVFELAMARTVGPSKAFGHGFFLAIGRRFPQSQTPSEEQILVDSGTHRGAVWDLPNILSAHDFAKYIDNLYVGSSTPAAHFAHFLHTHFPVDFDANCKYRSYDLEWFEESQDRAGFKAETICALRRYGSFLNKLESLGIYDKSLIVLKSDHGQPIRYTDPETVESFTIRGHDHWGYSRHTPFLAIKPRGRRDNQPQYDERLFALSDIARTVCELSSISGCGRFPGNVIAGGSNLQFDTTYVLNLVQGNSSTFQMDTHESVTFPRSRSLFSSLTEFLSDELLTHAIPCASTINLAAGKPFNNGLSDYRQWVTWKRDSVHNLKWTTPTCDATSVRLGYKITSILEPAQPIIVTFISSRKKTSAIVDPRAGSETKTQFIEIPISALTPENQLTAQSTDRSAEIEFLSLELND